MAAVTACLRVDAGRSCRVILKFCAARVDTLSYTWFGDSQVYCIDLGTLGWFEAVQVCIYHISDISYILLLPTKTCLCRKNSVLEPLQPEMTVIYCNQ